MRRLFPHFIEGPGAVGLLLLRLVMGTAFILHGWPKIQNPFGWMNAMGSSTPPLLQALAALAEFGGGIALIIGALTPIAALGTASTMLGALFLVHFPKGDPFVAPGQSSYELPLLYLVLTVALMTLGPGRLSVDYCLFGRTPAREAIAEAGDDMADIHQRAA
jgi:putative oxidoreductase